MDWNRRPDFRSVSQKSCQFLAHAIRWTPVAVISGVVTWSYYVFVVRLVLLDVSSFPQQTCYLLAYHAILFFFLLSFVKTIFTSPGEVPAKWRLSSQMRLALTEAKSEEEWLSLLELFALQMDVSVYQRSVQGAIRYCDRCFVIKPDRSHHCSICNACILKMDHHCPWVNNCVGFGNYKFFFLFLVYAYLYCIFLLVCLTVRLFGYWQTGSAYEDVDLHYAFLCLMSGVFFLFLSSLFWYHMFLVLKNRSTLEEFRAPVMSNGQENKFLYDLGSWKNIQQLFGENVFKWFMPIYTSSGDGLVFPRSHTSSCAETAEERLSLKEVPTDRVPTKIVGRRNNDGDGTAV